jgi:shikimate dehydrogenase
MHMIDGDSDTNPTDANARRYAVFGKPIAHSRSPRIHSMFAAQRGESIRYDAIEADYDGFPSALAAFGESGGYGANVTLPLKQLAAQKCRVLSEVARRSGVVNVMTRLPDGGWRGDNTDGVGLVHDITERHRLDLRGRRVLMLGAGGAVQGVVHALLDAGIDSLVLANRTPEKADAIADRVGDPLRVHTIYWHDLKDAGAFEMVVNGTAAAHHGDRIELPFALVNDRTLAYDLNYGRAAVDFLAWARSAGCHDVHDGLGMLVEQAAEAFNLWHGFRPDTDAVYGALRRES